MLSYEQIVEVSQEDARTELLEILSEVGFAATSWQEGSVALGLVEIGAWCWSKASGMAVALKKMGSSETAEGEGLARYSASQYQNTYREAVATQRKLRLTCEVGQGPHVIQAGQFSARGETYTFTNIIDPGGQYPPAYPVTLAPGSSVYILVESEAPGEDSNAPANSVTTIITTLNGVTITEDVPWVTGTNKESEPSLRLRNSLKWALLPALGLIDDSVEALARDAVEAVDRVRVDSTNPRGAGTLDVWVTGTTGPLTANELAQIKTAIGRRMMGDPDGTLLQVANAPLQPLNMTLVVYLSGSYDWNDVVRPLIIERLETWRRTIPLGGFPYPTPGNVVPLNEIEHVVRGLKIGDAEPVKTVKLTSPSSDVAVTSFAHVTHGTWTLSMVSV